ncbi:hypothetical protein G6F62_012915 [Rhizopus arrhizus]|nr:hypothetical protein G6F62_012915 [Rhizopus arrhizus]
MSTENKIPSEEILAQKWDRAISNFVVKTGLGLSAGIVASALLFKKRSWPIAIATGWGFGVAYADAQVYRHITAQLTNNSHAFLL